MRRKILTCRSARDPGYMVSTMEDYSEYYYNSTILVSVGAGAIGENLCRMLSTLGAKKVILLDNLFS